MRFYFLRARRWGVTLALMGLLASCNTSAQTKESVEAAIAAEVPAQASRIWVQNWVVKQGWKHTFTPHDKNRGGHPTLSAGVPDTTRNFPVTGDTFVEFVFDKNEKLQSYTATEIFTGP